MWEYKSETLIGISLKDHLNEMGKQDWELVVLDKRELHDGPYAWPEYSFIWKRKVEVVGNIGGYPVVKPNA